MGTRQPVSVLLTALHEKFGQNLKALQSNATIRLDRIDLNSRAIDGIGTELLSKHCDSNKQKTACAQLLDEIFADFSQSMYLLSIGLLVPARMVLRRGLELGLAVVYMWDIPHEYWGWKLHGLQLSFSEMAAHCSSEYYISHLANVNGCPAAVEPNQISTELKRLYAALSNTVHGRYDELPPLSPERYSSDQNKIDDHLKMAIQVQVAIINLLCLRFPEMQTYIQANFPGATRVA
ncbi:MAG: hypothetical protein ACJ8EF_06310 [Bradyrhizobium sp.]